MLLPDRAEYPSPPRLEPVRLAGRTVVLEPLAPHHLPPLVEIVLADPALWQWMPVLPSSELVVEKTMHQMMDESQDAGLSQPFAVIEPRTSNPIGATQFLDYRAMHRGVEIGWTWYARSAWGTRVNPEAKLLLMDHAFAVLRCVRVQFKTDARNARSRAAILKLGAKEEGILRRHQLTQSGGYIRDSVYFSVLDHEWPAVRARLQARLESTA